VHLQALGYRGYNLEELRAQKAKWLQSKMVIRSLLVDTKRNLREVQEAFLFQ
jgi:hypothetical protein